MLEGLLKFDSNLFLELNGMNSPWWDTAMLFFTRKEIWLALYLVLMMVIIRTYKNKAWIIIFFLIIGLVASEQFSVLIKYSVQRLRPGYDPVIQNLTHIVLRRGGMYGFVSSHASNALYLLTFTTLLFRNRISYCAILIWALLLSYTRIYVGAHFPLDVLGGWVLGGVTGFLFFRLLMVVENRFFFNRNPRIGETRLSSQNAVLVLWIFVTIIITSLLTVYILHKYNYL